MIGYETFDGGEIELLQVFPTGNTNNLYQKKEKIGN